MRHLLSLLVLISTVLPAPTRAEDASVDKKSLRKEARAVERRYRDRPVQAREDIRWAKASRETAVSDTADGQRWAHADSDVAFEKLGSVSIDRIRLRGPHRLLVELGPPVAWGRTPRGSLDEAAANTRLGLSERDSTRYSRTNSMKWVLLDLDPTKEGGVEKALSRYFFLDGEVPSEADIAECLARYPKHDSELSQARCSPH